MLILLPESSTAFVGQTVSQAPQAISHLRSKGLIKAVGNVVEYITACGGQINAGVHTELGVQCPRAAVTGGIEIGEIDTLIH